MAYTVILNSRLSVTHCACMCSIEYHIEIPHSNGHNQSTENKLVWNHLWSFYVISNLTAWILSQMEIHTDTLYELS